MKAAGELKRWRELFPRDFKQFLEPMIVHVLRHRRQIERFLGRPLSSL